MDNMGINLHSPHFNTTVEHFITNITTAMTSATCPPPGVDPYSGYKLFNFCLMMVISVCGIVGNILVLLTFSKEKRKTSPMLFLQALAVFDIMLICCFNLFSHRYAYNLILSDHTAVNGMMAGKITIAVLPIAYMAQSLSTWTIVAVALDRYIHICIPLKARRFCRISITKKIIGGITGVSVLYNIPRFFEYYKVLQVAETAINRCTGYFTVPEGTLGGNEVYQYSYAFGLYMVVMYAVPLVLLCFFNGNLIWRLKKMRVPGADGRTQKLKGSDKIVPSLVIIVTIFTLFQIPDMVLQILWRINSPKAPEFSIVAYDFVVMNSSVNFLVYVFSAEGFRRSLKAMICNSINIPTTSDSTSMEDRFSKKSSRFFVRNHVIEEQSSSLMDEQENIVTLAGNENRDCESDGGQEVKHLEPKAV